MESVKWQTRKAYGIIKVTNSKWHGLCEKGPSLLFGPLRKCACWEAWRVHWAHMYMFRTNYNTTEVASPQERAIDCTVSVKFLSDTGTVRIWHANTYRLENTLDYGLDRAWVIAVAKGLNVIGMGYDEGGVMIKVSAHDKDLTNAGANFAWSLVCCV